MANAKIGAVTVPLSPELKEEELCYILNHSDSTILLLGQEFRNRVASGGEGKNLSLIGRKGNRQQGPAVRGGSLVPSVGSGAGGELLRESPPRHLLHLGEQRIPQRGGAQPSGGRSRLFIRFVRVRLEGGGPLFMLRPPLVGRAVYDGPDASLRRRHGLPDGGLLSYPSPSDHPRGGGHLFLPLTLSPGWNEVSSPR